MDAPAPPAKETLVPEPPEPPEPTVPVIGVPGDDRTLSDVLALVEGARSVRIARHGPLRATCNGELLAPARGSRYAFRELAVMKLAEIDEALGCARIHFEHREYRDGFDGTIELVAWVDVADLEPVVTRSTRLVDVAGTVFADEVHGIWLGPGLEIERLGEVGEWTEVSTPKIEPQRRGLVRSADLGVVFDRIWFEEKRQEHVHAQDKHAFMIHDAPGGRVLAEADYGSPISITDDHVEVVALDYNAPLAIIGFAPRSLLTEPTPVDEDIWGALETQSKRPKLKPDEVDVAAKTELYSVGGTRLGATRKRIRLSRGEQPGTVVVKTDWGSVVLVMEKQRAR